MADRQPQSGPLAPGLAGVERLEHVLHHLGRQSTPVVFDLEHHLVGLFSQPDLHPPPSLHGVETIRHQVQDHLLDLGAVDLGIAAVGRQELDLAVAVFAEVLDHCNHLAHEVRQVGAFPLRVPAAGEVEQPLGDLFAAERFALDETEVLPEDPFVGRGMTGEQFIEATLERLGGHRHHREGIVDLVGDPRGQKPDPGEPF